MREHVVRLGVIGDVHLAFDDTDIIQLDAQGYTALLFVGDLASYSHRGGLGVAELVARLETRAIVVPGNHDTTHVGQMAAEVLEADVLVKLLAFGQRHRCSDLESALHPAELGSYSRHRIEAEGREVDVIVGRPFSAGGPRIASRPFLDSHFGVDDLEASAARLKRLVDESDVEELIFLAHNGPTGLGSQRDDIWGCDFRKTAGDFGDADLADAIDHASRSGRRVRAVVAGHMHHQLRGGGARRWQTERDGILYVNAAQVPRIRNRRGAQHRHHVELSIGDDHAYAREVWLRS